MNTARATPITPGTRFLVVGLGHTGLSCARYLDRQGARVTVVDSRERPPMLEALRRSLPETSVSLGGFDPALLESTDAIVLSPGVPAGDPFIQAALKRGLSVVGDVELFLRAEDAPYIAITGSNGKSTVTSLLSAMAHAAGLDVRTGANLGTPALDLLEDVEPDLYLLELSSFQLEIVDSLAPAVGILLNISADHMDRYESLSDYAAAKGRVFSQAGVAVANRDDPQTLELLPDGNESVVTFGLDQPDGRNYGVIEHEGATWLVRGQNDLILRADEVRLAGRHNLANALAAVAAADSIGIDREASCNALRTFSGLPHRTEFVLEHNGVRFINDSKATNVGAAIAAIEGLDGPLVLIAGGEGKEADFTGLEPAVSGKVRAAVLIGRDAGLIEDAIGKTCTCRHASSMAEAVTLAGSLAERGDTVLLSPACASFDMFDSFKARGQAFVAAVKEAVQ